VPNLFTVPGDPLAGFMLATGGVLHGRVAGAMATSLLLYAAGLLLNDYFDRHVDAKERPERPIPSGAASARIVLAVGLALLVAAVGVAFAVSHPGAGAVATALALTVFAYDAGLKRVRWLGPVVMGSCRAGSVVLGATFAFRPMPPPVLVAAGIAWAYTVCITVLAAGEVSGAPLGKKAFLPCMVLAAGGGAMAPFFASTGGVRFFGISLLAIAAIEASQGAIAVCRGRIPVPPFIGRLIRAMIAVQAAWCLWRIPLEAHEAGVPVLGAFVLLKLGAEFASRRFYGS
jgi:4-hydroxybenzoate polyprenyltransferase